MKKDQLLKRLEKAWATIKDSYTGFSDPQLMEPGVMGEWSVKDSLAHLTTWEEEMAFIKWTVTGIDGLMFILISTLLVIIAVGIMNR